MTSEDPRAEIAYTLGEERQIGLGLEKTIVGKGKVCGQVCRPAYTTMHCSFSPFQNSISTDEASSCIDRARSVMIVAMHA